MHRSWLYTIAVVGEMWELTSRWMINKMIEDNYDANGEKARLDGFG